MNNNWLAEEELPPICLRVPAEVLLDIFALLVPNHQSSLHACTLTCRRWNQVAVTVLWRRPHFSRLSQVVKFSQTLLIHGYYARFVESLSFSTLPEPDRNSPQLAGLLDTIVCKLTVVSTANSALATTTKTTATDTLLESSQTVGSQTTTTTCTNGGSLKRSKSFLQHSNDNSQRPHSTTDLTIPEGDNTNNPVPIQHPAKPTTNQQPTLIQSMDDTSLHYTTQSYGQASAAISAAATATKPTPVTYVSLLKHLDLRFCKGVRNYSLQRLAPRLATVQVLNLAGGLRTDITIAKLSQHVSNLRRISLSWTSHLTDFGVAELVQKCPSIECIDLTYCTQIEDTSLFAIAHHLPHLLALSVAYCAGITDVGIREVATRCQRLRVLNVAKCLRVTDSGRRFLEQHKIIYLCDSFDHFSIHNRSVLSAKQK